MEVGNLKLFFFFFFQQMGKKLKKNTQGEATKYVGRTQAIKKLQITLAQFRRLCILKGVYPVEPKNKKVKKKSTLLQTFYYKKDIQYLLHEPILQTLREEQIYKRKLNKAIHKKESDKILILKDNKPIFKLDHLVKERYPSFDDALKDLDDSLSMVALFTTLSSEVVPEQV
jgi:pescadillo protein